MVAGCNTPLIHSLSANFLARLTGHPPRAEGVPFRIEVFLEAPYYRVPQPANMVMLRDRFLFALDKLSLAEIAGSGMALDENEVCFLQALRCNCWSCKIACLLVPYGGSALRTFFIAKFGSLFQKLPFSFTNRIWRMRRIVGDYVRLGANRSLSVGVPVSVGVHGEIVPASMGSPVIGVVAEPGREADGLAGDALSEPASPVSWTSIVGTFSGASPSTLTFSLIPPDSQGTFQDQNGDTQAFRVQAHEAPAVSPPPVQLPPVPSGARTGQSSPSRPSPAEQSVGNPKKEESDRILDAVDRIVRLDLVSGEAADILGEGNSSEFQ